MKYKFKSNMNCLILKNASQSLGATTTNTVLILLPLKPKTRVQREARK